MSHRNGTDTNRLRQEVLGRQSPATRKPSSNGKAKDNRFAPINALVDHHLADLNGVETKVYLTIWRWINAKTKVASISHQQIAEICGVEKRSVIRSLKTLTEKKLIRRTKKGNSETHTSNSYIVLTPT